MKVNQGKVYLPNIFKGLKYEKCLHTTVKGCGVELLKYCLDFIAVLFAHFGGHIVIVVLRSELVSSSGSDLLTRED